MTGTEACEKIMESVNGLISGKEDVVRKVMTAIIAGGHILIEDIPGVGKTTMAKAFAAAMGLDNRRIQFTTDVMPSDITGFMMFDKWKNDFVNFFCEFFFVRHKCLICVFISTIIKCAIIYIVFIKILY